MLVRHVMSRHPHYCTLSQRASEAAREMWTHAIGCVPVVDEDRRPVGILTDRDLCLAAYRLNLRLDELRLADVMSRGLYTCMASDSLSSAERTMRTWHVRRLPVVDQDGKLVGVLSLDDIILSGAQSWPARVATWLPRHAQKTVIALIQRRTLSRRTMVRASPRREPSSR